MPSSKVPRTSSVKSAGNASKSVTKGSAQAPAKQSFGVKGKTSKSPSAKNDPTGKARKPAFLPKSDGDAGVQAYMDSMEPWQAAIARRVDSLVVKHVPNVRKAVRWHCPFYGVEGQGWFLAFAGFQRHIKFSFFKGSLLVPTPPVGKFKEVRSVDVREAPPFDEQQFADWIKQAAAIPGWDGGSPGNGGTPQ